MVITNKLGKDCGNIISRIENEGSFFTGYDVKNGISIFILIFIDKVVDMIDAGIVDSYNVVKTVL